MINNSSVRLYSQARMKIAQPNAFHARSKWPVDSLPGIISQIVQKTFGNGVAASVVDYSLLQG